MDPILSIINIVERDDEKKKSEDSVVKKVRIARLAVDVFF